MIDHGSAEHRIRALLIAARRLADPGDELGQAARRDLPASTGLSRENVEAGLRLCLETEIAPEALKLLVENAASCSRAHVLLPANVFIAPVRAILLALASGPEVYVRPSRREPLFVDLLQRAAPGLFQIVPELDPNEGDQVWAYGSDATLAELAASLAPGIVLHAHGSGMGVVLLDEQQRGADSTEALTTLCDGIALDVALFDQRGCLSPRLVLTRAREAFVERFRQQLELSFVRIEARIPRGVFTANERAELTWYRESVAAIGSWHSLPCGGIGVVYDELELIPPPGRHLQICVVSDLTAAISALAPLITSVAHSPDLTRYRHLHALLSGARFAEPGKMQQPPLDGPVDRRTAL